MYKKLFFACIGLLCTSLLYAQTKINGLVTDEVNMPLAGVSVSVKNTKRGTATDSAGRFT
ncbi:MAG: carboxypeptidase-like regulatory domain-containing protein, partial [Chitinophagaceae bacterium]|nr:carboxypeptidase-like regulatory domain-containing protein [Chitinophagaceae bacterium]